jgi:biopolymer transport protein ExbD
MTTTTIIQIALAILLIWLIKLYFSRIDKKINADIEKEKERKEKEKKADEEKADKENYWLIKYQRELKETLDAIERRTIQTEGKRYDINGKFDCHYNDILELAKKLSHFLDKNDKSGDIFRCFDTLLKCYYFERPQLEKGLEDLRLYYKEKNEELQKEKQKLELKQQELELRETRIIKIESAQKILNSELVEKINKEIE